MRTIKFRGKRVDNGEWVYGYYRMFFNSANGTENHFIANDYSETEQVVPETVGQFTGLHDKNGKDIYEGDLLHRHLNVYGKVVFSNSRWLAQFPSILWLDANKFIECEIIGNIHDNHELLKS